MTCIFINSTSLEYKENLSTNIMGQVEMKNRHRLWLDE